MNNVVCVISPLQGFLFAVDYIALTDYAVEYHPCRVSFLFVVDFISVLLYFDMLVCQTPSPCGYSLLSKRKSCFLFVFQWVT